MTEILQQIGWLALLALVAFGQNMAFTWTSRSRNSGDPSYHRKAAWCSNSVWLVCHMIVWKQIWGAFESGSYFWLVPMSVIYVIATTEGSVLMMKILLKKETGSRKVGASGD